MPEGDTLHRAARRLQALVGQRISAESPHPRGRATRVAETVDGRTLESVEAIGKNLRFRFSGGVVLRSHLRMSGRWSVRPRGERRVGSPWLVLRGDRVEGVLWNGPVLELHDRALRRLGPDILERPPRLDAMLHASARRRRHAHARRDAARPVARRRDREHVARRSRCGTRELSPWRRLRDVPEHDRLPRARDGRDADARVARHRPRGRGACIAAPGSPVRAARASIASWGLGDDNRTAYWCPRCQAGMDPRGA